MTSLEQTEDPFESASTTELRPSVPPPTASSKDVRAFLVQFFCALDYERTLEYAVGMSRKMEVNGKALYELPEEEWVDIFGIEGRTIYHTLQTSKYGYVS